jgi:hypothetical protein
VSTHDWDGPPPDLELSDPLHEMLASALEQGAPLQAPYPSQARYSRLAGLTDERTPWRRTVLAFAAGAALMSLAFLFAGVPQPRTWIVQTVDSVVHDITAPAATPPAESSAPGTQERPATTPSEGEAHGSASPTEAGEPPSGEAGEAGPTPSPESSGDGDHQAASPSPSPTPKSGDGGGSDGGGPDGGGASSPSPTPTPDSDGGH